jgi:hypothetical protein
MKKKFILLLLFVFLFKIVLEYKDSMIMLRKYSNRENYNYHSMTLHINGEDISFPKKAKEFLLLYSELSQFLDSLTEEAESYERGISSDVINISLNYDNDFLNLMIAYSKNKRKISLQVFDKKGRSFVKYYNANMKITESFLNIYHSTIKALR